MNNPTAKQAAIDAMKHDEDIAAEAEDLSEVVKGLSANASRGNVAAARALRRSWAMAPAGASAKFDPVPLNWREGQGGHRPNAETVRLLREAGGREKLKKFTTEFYKKSFADPHIDKFIRDHNDPHGERFANWICEKFGDGTPWTAERATRSVCPFQSHGHRLTTPHDRSSAHFAAWHSPKREPHKFGQHFKLDDCRVWMRLHFWAARETGVFDHKGFEDYYVKFIGHFVSVYERSATEFARDSARWSLDPKNIEKYVAAGNRMNDVIGVPLRETLKDLPEHERFGDWPYTR